MATQTAQPKTQTARLKELYRTKLANELKSELKLRNIHEVPKLEKIVINVGAGRAKDDKKLLEIIGNTLSKITGQKAVETISKKSIASFKLREGNKIGMRVTLRDHRMYEFLERLITVVLPRVRDFHGLSLKSFDKQGNFSFGLNEQSVFPELSFEDTANAHGLQITLTIKTKSAKHSELLLNKFGFPLEKRPKKIKQEEK